IIANTAILYENSRVETINRTAKYISIPAIMRFSRKEHSDDVRHGSPALRARSHVYARGALSLLDAELVDERKPSYRLANPRGHPSRAVRGAHPAGHSLLRGIFRRRKGMVGTMADFGAAEPLETLPGLARSLARHDERGLERSAFKARSVEGLLR